MFSGSRPLLVPGVLNILIYIIGHQLPFTYWLRKTLVWSSDHSESFSTCPRDNPLCVFSHEHSHTHGKKRLWLDCISLFYFSSSSLATMFHSLQPLHMCIWQTCLSKETYNALNEISSCFHWESNRGASLANYGLNFCRYQNCLMSHRFSKVP